MNLTNVLSKERVRAAGWHSRGYLPHFDGAAVPQFITLHLADSIPSKVVQSWQNELSRITEAERRLELRKRIEKYLDIGYGECLLRDIHLARMVQESLLAFDSVRYKLFAWVVMPNHMHSLFTCCDGWQLQRVMHSHKSFTAHEANRLLNRTGQFWAKEYYDRYIRNAEHFRNTIRYIENNPVKAGLCSVPSDWPFSSAWFRERSQHVG